MKITICSPKGGVGKSTASLLLAAALARANHTVSIQDLDPDGTASKSASRLSLSLHPGGAHRGFLIVDTPPSLAHDATRAAIANADLVIVVSGVDTADLEKLPASIPTILGLRGGKPVRLLLNRLPAARTLAAQTLPVVRDQLAAAGLPTLQATLSHRMAFAYSHSAGWAALNAPAQGEVMAFAVEALGHLMRSDTRS